MRLGSLGLGQCGITSVIFALPAAMFMACTDDLPSDTDDTGSDTDIIDDTDDTDTDTDTGEPTDWPDGFEDCGIALPTPAEGLCEVEEGTGSAVVLRGMVLGYEKVYVSGSVVVDGERIADVGCVEPPAGATIISCAEGVISPGLIDPHDHLGFTDRAPYRFGDKRWDHRHGWRAELSTPGNRWTGSANGFASEQWGEVRKLVAGTTTMVGSGYARGIIRNLDQASARESDALPVVENQTFPLGDANRQFRSNCGWNYRDDGFDASKEDAYVPHVAEGIDDYAAEEFRCLSTDFAGGEDLTESNSAHVHGIGLQTLDYDRMVRDGTALIWSPRSNLQLYGETARVSTFATLGGVIALGSDWTYSGSIHPGREMACADSFNKSALNGFFSDKDIWKMATENAAIALRADADVGTLETGKLADIAIFAEADDVKSPWRAPLEAKPGETALVLRGGTPLYGEAGVLGVLDSSCESVDVCGESHAICMERETGRDFAALAGVVSEAYPAWFCDSDPTDEPVCSTKREGDWPGEATAGDQDGDGVADGDDLCPAVFNPIRPIDSGEQSDVDGDGTGDACDDDPLPADIDGDGIPNDTDNCPYQTNPDQTDVDGDDKGDICDACPDVANPTTPCAAVSSGTYTLEELRTRSELIGSPVTVKGVVVTGIWDNGYAVQETSGSGPNRGMMVYEGSAPSLAVGDIIDLNGDLNDYFGELQIEVSAATKTSSGPAPAPTVVSLTDAASEGYEGMLITTTGEVTDEAYDCSVDGGGCSDTGLWEIGGSSGILVYDRMYSGADWASGSGTTTVSGVMTFRWNRRRIMPRNDTDLGL